MSISFSFSKHVSVDLFVIIVFISLTRVTDADKCARDGSNLASGEATVALYTHLLYGLLFKILASKFSTASKASIQPCSRVSQVLDYHKCVPVYHFYGGSPGLKYCRKRSPTPMSDSSRAGSMLRECQ